MERFGCSGYTVYADLQEYNDCGLNKGIHLWSVKLLTGDEDWSDKAGCYASIGVITEKNNKLINDHNKGYRHWMTHLGSNSYYE